MNGKVLAFRQAAASRLDVPDETLLAACGAGDRSALGALFDRYSTDVYRLLGRLRGTDARDLPDLLQSTFVEVQKSAARFRGHAAVKTWILGVAANVVRHHVRGEVRRRVMLDACAELPQRPSELPSEAAERRQLLVRLANALDLLPPKLREAFVLCDLEEIPGVEVARLLKLPPGTLWRRLFEARQALRQAMEEAGQ